VNRGKLLGGMITQRGIEANPKKIDAVRQMKLPTTKRGVQKLTGRLASLNRFIFRLAEKRLPFFRALESSGNLQWGKKQEKAFEALKTYIENVAIMSSPSEKSRITLVVGTEL